MVHLLLGKHSRAVVQDAEAGRRLETTPYMIAVQETAKLVDVPTPTLNIISTLVQHYDANLARRVSI